jgi:uncharacterized membrane protein YjjP (DUF1212 family)
MKEQEKHREIQHRHIKDPISPITGGLIVVWLGVVFLLRNMGFLYWRNWWAYFILGIGVILILESIIRSAIPQYRCGVAAKLIVGIILFTVGGIFIYGARDWWPLIIIAVGLFIIFGTIWKFKSSEG